MMRKVLFLSGDLIFASRVRAAAEASGCIFELTGKIPAVNPSSDGISSEGVVVEAMIIDLSTRSGALEEAVAAARERFPEARLIAYAPHVQVGRLKAAREAGVSEVFTRGQFDAKLPSLFLSET